MTNYELAKEEADKTDQKIITLISQCKNIKVEAGAGAGKTYSLHKVIDWFNENKMNDFRKQKRKIACITYTNVAVEVIKKRIGTTQEIVPSTIHSFAWDNIKQFPSALRLFVKELGLITSEELLMIKSVNYTLGVRSIENGVLYLYHNDVISLFCKFLDYPKFRFILENKYAAILIDEYQDSYKEIMDKLVKYFIETKTKLQVCLFGDAWQTIYQSNNACGEVVSNNLISIDKKVNFRSAKNIVKALNNIRPNLPQISAIDNFDGEIYVVDCNDYEGDRRTSNHFKGDLTIEELNKRVLQIKNKFNYENESLKTLMLTHKLLASHQGYETLLEILEDSLKNMSDELFNFVAFVIENIYECLKNNDVSSLCEILKSKPAINTRKEKNKWNKFFQDITEARENTIFDVLKIVIESKLVPTPIDIIKLYDKMCNDVDEKYNGRSNLRTLKKVSYSEFVVAKQFLMPYSIYSTEHGVKGEEYDNVIFVISRGWNNYQFDKFLPMEESEVIKNLDAYIRNRNLFYVCCSRPKKRLCLLITFEVNKKFKDYLIKIFGEQNYYSYKDFIE